MVACNLPVKSPRNLSVLSEQKRRGSVHGRVVEVPEVKSLKYDDW